MIAYLRGIVYQMHENNLILDVNGVGYEVLCTASLVKNLFAGEPAAVQVYTEVKENAINLFGFSDAQERAIFLALITVKGVGAKSACDIMSQVPMDDLVRMIVKSDLTGLQRLKGVGDKTAQLIIIELKDKLGSLRGDWAFGNDINPVYEEAEEALIALGFNKKLAIAAVKKAIIGLTPNSETSASEIVKAALKFV